MIKNILERHTQDIDAIPEKHIGLWIALAAALGLYIELMIIRVHSSYFELFAIFKNISLLSCFLGLGIGYMRGRIRPLLTPFVLPALSLQILILHIITLSKFAVFLQYPMKEQCEFGIWPALTKQTLFIYAFLLFIFAFNALCFIPLGQLVSKLMARREKLTSYSWNLLGSLLGIVFFTFISLMWLPPSVWILSATGMIMPFFYQRLSAFLPALLSVTVILIVLSLPHPPGHFEIYSPYQKLTLIISKNKPVLVDTSNTYYQRLLDLRSEKIRQDKTWEKRAQYYNFPYLFKNNPDRVLIVGSGAGNDVAAALRNNAKAVSAVEIDPAIVEIGRQLHPEAPYQNSKVKVFINDARAFIRYTKDQYDLIVYGRIDSHGLLSGNSGGIRLESYVYTVEAFKEARKKLKDDGVLCLTFTIFHPELGKKLFSMLQEAFEGQKPLVYQAGPAQIFLAGKYIRSNRRPLGATLKEVSADYDNGITADQSTDDWPFFYMPKRVYPVAYTVLFSILLIISIISIRVFVKDAQTNLSWPCFLLGAGFMLIEAKGITELSLIYGSTWLVINIVVASILVMAFMANILVMKIGSPSALVTYGLLAISVLIGYNFTYMDWSGLNQWCPKLIVPAILTLPVFFSGFAFSTELMKSVPIAEALSSNLLGAMLGGILEYNSMYFGFKSLYILAFIIYGLAFFTATKVRSFW